MSQPFLPDPLKPQRRAAAALALAGAFLSLSSAPLLAQSVATSYDGKFVTDLASTPLTASDFELLTCNSTGGYQIYGAGTGYTAQDLCRIATSDAQFYSSTAPSYYKFKPCTNDPTNYIVIGNLLVQTGRLDLQSQSYWLGTDTTQPASNVTFDLCSQPKVGFTFPSGYTPSATSTAVLLLARRDFSRSVDSVPQNAQRPTYSTNALQFVISGVAGAGTATLPYTQQGTAVYNSDYGIDSTNSAQMTGNTLTINVAQAGAFGLQVLLPSVYNPNNHPASSLQFAFQTPAGFKFLGQPVWYGGINALQRPAVSISDTTTTLNPGATNQFFTLTRSGTSTTTDLTVNYAIGGTAVNGTDYGYLSGVATIPAGQSSLNVPIYATASTTAQTAKTVKLTVTPSTNATGYLAAATPNNQLNLDIPAYTPSTVSFTQTSGGGTLAPGQPQQVTVTRTGSTTQPLTVGYTTGGSATAGSDYKQLPGSVTIPAGATSATIPVESIQQTGTTATPSKTLSLTPSSGTGYDASGAQPSNFTIPAYTPMTVSVSSPSNGGAIANGGTAPFTVTRTGDTSQPLTIPYTTGGTGTSGTDYGQLPGSITIPAGATSATQTITTPTQNGSASVPSKTITLTPSAGTGYSVDSTNGTATYTTAAYTPSSVTPSAGSGGSTIAQGTTGGFTITRTGATTSALPVSYTLGGTAMNGTDYNQLPGSVTIPAGQSSVTVPVTVPANTGSTATAAKDIQVTVNPGTGYAPSSTTPSTSLTIPAYTPSMVSFGTTNGGALTPGGTSDGFTVTRTGSTTSPLTVNLATAGSATPGVDYGQLPATVTIPAGATSVTVPLRAFPQSGSAATPQKDVQISLQPGSGYTPGSATPATYTIPAYAPNANGNPAVTVSVPTGENTVLKAGTTRDAFTVTRTGATTSPLVVNYTVGGTATSGTDYTPLSGTVTIPAGATSASVPISTPAGATDGKTVAINVTPGTGYNQGTNSTVTYTVEGARTGGPLQLPRTLVGLSFDPAIPAFVVTCGLPLPQSLTVPIDFGGTGVPGVDYSALPTSVTFAPGQTSVTVPVKLLPTATTGNTIIANIPAGSGYTVGTGNGTAFTVPAGYNDGSNTASKPSSTGSTKKGGSGGAVGFVAAAGVVGGSIALGTGALGGGAAAAAGAGSALAVPGLLASSVFGLIPQSCATTGETPTELVKLIPQLKDGQPNWSDVTFRGLPAPNQAGSVKLANGTRDWKAGQPVADIVRLSDTAGSFNAQCMGLSKLANLGQSGMALKPLATLNLVADTTVQGLSKTIYLRAKKIGDVKGMAELLASKSGGTVTAAQLEGMSFADALKANPALAALPMGAMPLNQIPGYSDILLGDIPNWQSKPVSQVFGLANVPFSQFPTQPKPLSAYGK